MAENDKVLLRRYHEQGDLQAREQLIEQYMSLVRSLARRYSYRGEQLDDHETLREIEHHYEVSEDRALLEPGFRVLDDRERTILHLRFFEGLTQSQIAQQVGISQMHVSRLSRRALEKIREEIASDEAPRRAADRRR